VSAFPNPSTQFQPGSSGNPSGRPKGRTLASWLQELLAETESGDCTQGERLARKLIELALDGDVKALKLIADRHDGRVPLHVQLEQVTKAYDVGNSPDDI
jgi:hypothetical protein